MKLKKKKIIVCILCMFLFLGLMFFVSQLGPLKELFPVHFFIIQTGSMMPEIQIGELVFVGKKQDYQEGDIITYKVNQSYFVTHRIIAKTEEGFFTKGDFNNTKDEKMIKKEEIQGKVMMHSKVLGIIFQYRIILVAILLLFLTL